MKKTTTLCLLKSLVFIVILLLTKTAICQPAIQWAKCFGGTGEDNVYSIQQTMDSGYVVAGYTMSNDGDVLFNNGNKDFFVVKMDQYGNLQWQKSLGGSGDDWAYSIKQTIDSGYIVAGWTSSNDSMVSGNHGSADAWIVKLNSSGELEWQKCFGGSSGDAAWSIQQTYDTGYIFVGYSGSNDGDASMNHGIDDFWIVKLNHLGTLQWQKSLGGSYEDMAFSVQQTKDSGYIVAGETQSGDGDVTGYQGGSRDCWVVKLNSIGDLQWERCYGGNGKDIAQNIIQTNDGGYIFAGETDSFNDDVIGNHGLIDYWVVKISDTGTIQWQKCLGGDSEDQGNCVQQTSDGGFIVSGIAYSNNGDVSGNHGGDVWMVKLNVFGSIQWQKCYGGNTTDLSNAMLQTLDGGFISTGCTLSNEGDVTGNHGGWDFWVVKLASENSIQDNNINGDLSIYPNPTTDKLTFTTNLTNTTLTLDILDINGRILQSTQCTNGRKVLDVSNFKKGVYIVKVRSAEQSSFVKFIKL